MTSKYICHLKFRLNFSESRISLNCRTIEIMNHKLHLKHTFSFEPKNILGGAKFSYFRNIQSFQGFSFKKLFPFTKS